MLQNGVDIAEQAKPPIVINILGYQNGQSASLTEESVERRKTAAEHQYWVRTLPTRQAIMTGRVNPKEGMIKSGSDSKQLFNSVLIDELMKINAGRGRACT